MKNNNFSIQYGNFPAYDNIPVNDYKDLYCEEFSTGYDVSDPICLACELQLPCNYLRIKKIIPEKHAENKKKTNTEFYLNESQFKNEYQDWYSEKIPIFIDKLKKGDVLTYSVLKDWIEKKLKEWKHSDKCLTEHIINRFEKDFEKEGFKLMDGQYKKI